MNDNLKEQFSKLAQMVEDQQKLVQTLSDVIKQQNQDILSLQTKRILQADITPGAIKNRAMGEPNSYIYSGLAANRPTTGVKLTTTGLGCSIYFETDTGKLKIWSGTSWLSVTLT